MHALYKKRPKCSREKYFVFMSAFSVIIIFIFKRECDKFVDSW